MRPIHPRLKRELPPNVKPYCVEEIAQGVEGAEIIVSGVSSPRVHWIGKTLASYLQPGQMVIAVTKGLEATPDGNLTILPDVLANELPESVRDQVTYSAVGGPCIAGELAARRQTCVVFGSRDRAAVEKLASVFRTPYYHVWPTTELVGLEYGVALKNAYALAVGLASGMLEKQGTPSSFAYGLPGAGDLYVTSAGGRTVRLGALMGKGHAYDQAREIMAGETLEAVEIIRAMSRALPKVIQRHESRPEELPLMRAQNLDALSILNALRQGHFYSTIGPELYSVQWEGDQVTVRCSPARTIFLVGDIWHCPMAAQAWDGNPITEATFTLHRSQRYWRVEVVDMHCQSAWTNAYAVNGGAGSLTPSR